MELFWIQIIKSYRWMSIYHFCDKNAAFAHFCDKMLLWQIFATKMPHLQIYATKMPYLQFFATKMPYLQMFATKIPWWILNVFPAPLQWHACMYLNGWSTESDCCVNCFGQTKLFCFFLPAGPLDCGCLCFFGSND